MIERRAKDIMREHKFMALHKERQMSNDPRDTQFAGFALASRQEIFSKLNWLDFGFTLEQQASIDHAIDGILTRRAYDLATHVYEHTLGAITRNPELGLREVPDMPVLPEEK
jgi:hypothetical protein